MERIALPPPSTSEWPPESVWREVDRASRVWNDLHADGRELHFELDEESGRLAIEMRDLAGNMMSIVSPSEALAIASG